MNQDQTGTTLRPGDETWERYWSKDAHQWMIHYETMSLDGALFSCEARDLETARRKLDKWVSGGMK